MKFTNLETATLFEYLSIDSSFPNISLDDWRASIFDTLGRPNDLFSRLILVTLHRVDWSQLMFLLKLEQDKLYVVKDALI